MKKITFLLMLAATVLRGNAQSVVVGNISGSFPKPNFGVYSVDADTLTNTAYFGGNFTQFGDSARSLFAAVDMRTYEVKPIKATFSGSYGTSSAIRAIAQNDTAVFVAGDFLTVDGEDRKCLAAFNKQTGALSPFRVDIITNGIFPSEVVLALKIDGNMLYVGGVFDTVGGVARKNLAAIDLTTSTVTSWNPAPNSTVNALEVNSDYVFAGGTFTDIGGLVKQGLAGLTKGATANAIAGFPAVLGGNVFAIKFHEGALYLGGSFNQVGNDTRLRLAKVDVAGAAGTVSAWNPLSNISSSPQLNSMRVQAIEAKGRSIFVSGQFTSPTLRPNGAEFDAITGVENEIEAFAFGLVFANKLVNNHLILAAPSFDFKVIRSFDTIPQTQCGSYGFDDGTEIFTSGVFPRPAVDFLYRDTIVYFDITIKPKPSDSVAQVYNSLVVLEDSADNYIWFAGCTFCGGKEGFTANAGRDGSGCAEYIGDFTTNTFTPDSSGDYLVIISKNGCNAFSRCINFVQCTVDTAISKVNDSLVASATNATAYEWFNCNTNTSIAGATGRSYKPTVSGSYGVRVTDPACGVVTTRCINVNVVISGLSNLFDGVQATVYPNPTSSMLNIESNEELEAITVTDLMGREIFSQSKIQNLQSKIDVSELADAVYFIQIKTTTGKKAVKTFVRQ